MTTSTGGPTPMTGPEHVREALRLAALAEASSWEDLSYPTDEHRYRMLMRAHLHANLARTAAMVDTIQWNTGTATRDQADEKAWHRVFSVKNPRL